MALQANQAALIEWERSVPCPSCGARVGAPCVELKTQVEKGRDVHVKRLKANRIPVPRGN